MGFDIGSLVLLGLASTAVAELVAWWKYKRIESVCKTIAGDIDMTSHVLQREMDRVLVQVGASDLKFQQILGCLAEQKKAIELRSPLQDWTERWAVADSIKPAGVEEEEVTQAIRAKLLEELNCLLTIDWR